MPTLLESIKDGEDVRRVDVIKTITERSPVLKMLPFTEIKGNAYTFEREKSLPTVAARARGGTYSRNTGVNESVTERLTIWGGEVFIDNFDVNTMGNVRDLKRRHYRQKARAMAIEFSETFFEGDQSVSGLTFDGLRKRSQLMSNTINAGTGGATLTFDMLDELIDGVVGDEDGKHLFMNKTLRRKVTALARDHSGHPLIDVATNRLGHQVMRYNGVPIHIIEREDNEGTFLAFDEDDGSSNLDTASIYCVRFGEDYVYGLRGAGSSLEVKDFGETEAAPGHMGRIEAYWGLAVGHPRSFKRLIHINDA